MKRVFQSIEKQVDLALAWFLCVAEGSEKLPEAERAKKKSKI
ncbi:MAG: hypothetical protein RBS57_09035 [Desulforhabdus sp.]|jgi:hypothetical protein|nr:hypothetical protein [Desulforhabdus sp.]